MAIRRPFTLFQTARCYGTLLLGTLVADGLHAQQSAALSDWRLQGIERVVAISDIHGAWKPFISLLQGTALTDSDLRWTGGASHLVIVGDAVDRGDASRQVLDLLMRLEQEAAAAGGAVHMVLGNHEIMNLSGELGYVTRDDFAAWRDLEPAPVRRRAMGRFAALSPGLRSTQLRGAFDRRYARGYFGHRLAFAPDGPYGSWLLEKPLVLVINDIAFVHAGLPARLLEQGVEALNEQGRSTLRRYLDAMQVLLDEEVLLPETEFQAQASLARRYLDNTRNNNTAAREAASTLLTEAEQDPFGHDSAVWYRGMVDCSPALEQARLQQALQTLGVARLVVGHTPSRNRLLQQRFDNGLLLADTGMLASYYGGQPAALVFEDEAMSVYYADDATTAQPAALPRLVGARPGGIDDDALAALLADTPWISATARDDTRHDVSLPYADSTFDAVFNATVANAAAGSFIPEVAAYRLDRLLGFDLFPVAVRAELMGRLGALYLEQDSLPLLPSASDEPWCPLPDQQALGQIFDFLLNVDARPADQQHYTEGNWKLVLSPHAALFATTPPAALPATAAALVSPWLRTQLAALTTAQLEQELGDVLDPARRQALLERRDLLLELVDR